MSTKDLRMIALNDEDEASSQGVLDLRACFVFIVPFHISGTSLFVAAVRGNEEVVQQKLNLGAQADTEQVACDLEGHEMSATAYQYCYHYGEMEIADLLPHSGVENGS